MSHKTATAIVTIGIDPGWWPDWPYRAYPRSILPPSRAHEAKTTLAFAQFAEPWAQIALDSAIFKPMPVAARHAIQSFARLRCFVFAHR